MNLTDKSESAENCLKQMLEEFFVSVYDENRLPSHGLGHHQRVWKYARQLLSLSCRQDLVPAIDPQELLIACYLHDAGMSDDPGPGHGKRSREICTGFLKKFNIPSDHFPDLLHTIEYHDRKDYLNNTYSSPLLKLLSVADDLDAFGNLGIYRYSEIYIVRGVELADLGEKVRLNAKVRFRYFLSEFRYDKALMDLHTKRFSILDSFFLHFETESVKYDFNSLKLSGYCGVLQMIMSMIRNRSSFNLFIEELGRYNEDSVIKAFRDGLIAETDS